MYLLAWVEYTVSLLVDIYSFCNFLTVHLVLDFNGSIVIYSRSFLVTSLVGLSYLNIDYLLKVLDNPVRLVVRKFHDLRF